MTKRKVFDELVQGFDELQREREGRLTLKNTQVEQLPPVVITPTEIIAIRTTLNMSAPVFAAKLRVNARTYEGWEQGKSAVASPTAALLKLVQKHPELLDEVSTL